MFTVLMVALLLIALFSPIMGMNSEKPLWKRVGIGLLFVVAVITVYSVGADGKPNNGCNELTQQGNC
jgi:MFS-type transporter involved in bile tolerance (Atg22 family)